MSNNYYPYRDAIKNMMDNGWNVRDDLKHLSLEELQEHQKNETLPYSVCAVNVLGDLNVGMMLRSAVVFGAEKFFIVGRRKFDRRSAVGAQNYMDVVRVAAVDDHLVSNCNLEVDSQKVYDTVVEHGYVPILFETGGRDFREMNQIWDNLNSHSKKPCLIFGSESDGLPKPLVEMVDSDYIVSIPQWGVLRSLNVSAAASIAMYDAATKAGCYRKHETYDFPLPIKDN